VAGVRPQHFDNDLISGLPGLTTDARLLISIRDELPVLMEAAPDPLLAALEHLLGGNEGAVAPLLKEKEGFLSSSSPLTHVLWALERMAWDPKYLERTSLLLAQLAERDPGGRLSNRPINSLQTIFLAWLPSTHARLEQRLAALDTLVSQHNGVGWELLLKLLPKNSSATSLTIKPRYRDAGASARATLTVGDVRRTYVYVINRALELASDEPNRWLSLIGEFDDFPLEMRRRFYERLEPHFQTLQGEERRKAWEAVRDKVARHRSFAHAAWALPEDELQVLDTLLAANQPAAALDRHRWLFDEWFPDVSGDSKEREGKIAEARVAALNDLLAEDYSTVLAAAYAVKLPHTLGQTVAKALSMEAIQQFAEDLYRDQAARSFVIALSSQAFERFGSLWKDFVIGLQRQEGSSSHAIAALLVGWPDRTDTWEFAASLGEATEEQYWLQKQPFRLEGGDADVERAIETYLRLGRPTAALNTASDSFNRLPQALLFSILDNLPSELNAAGQSLDQLSVYLIEQALEALSGRDDVNISDVAAREYQYLEIFRFSDKTLSIHRLMAIDPEFYFSIIMDVFRPSGEEQIEPVTEKQLSRAKSGYRLLSEFKLLPGQDSGTVDYDSLRKWMDRLKALSKEYDRVEITASYIGHVLAHSIADERDGVWPHRSVRRVIEEERSEPLEEGFAVEVFNSRGTYSKAIFEGGRQERALEEQYRESARKIVEPRTSAMLHKIADDYARQAASEDIRAEQDKVARH
ncbi:MAG: hypothetical protein Q7J32_16990, partial [Sphingomonadaceae bacterium]|nr:hypothetical protein [Sphingomonadaceae bacterium]